MEMRCINLILDFYKENKDIQKLDSNIIWISKLLTVLMNELDEAINYLQVKNCLILLINLLINVKTPDQYHTQGKSSEKLDQYQREELNDLLKQEVFVYN